MRIQHRKGYNFGINYAYVPMRDKQILPHIWVHLLPDDPDKNLPEYGHHVLAIEPYHIFIALDNEGQSVYNPLTLSSVKVYQPQKFITLDEWIKLKGEPFTLQPYWDEYCDMGCYDCGHEYNHPAFEEINSSGAVLIPQRFGNQVPELGTSPRIEGGFTQYFSLRD